jgi:hypothetical protein
MQENVDRLFDVGAGLRVAHRIAKHGADARAIRHHAHTDGRNHRLSLEVKSSTTLYGAPLGPRAGLVAAIFDVVGQSEGEGRPYLQFCFDRDGAA